MRPDRPRTRRAAGPWRSAAIVALLLPAVASADSITLTWTASGDDGAVGRASTYDLRYSDHPIAGADTASWWSAAQSVGTLPAPLTAGGRESFTLTGLATGQTLYFAIRVADEVPNWSGFSNVSMRTAGGGAALATPASFSARLVAGGVALAWSEPAAGAGSGYRLYRRVGASGADSALGTLPVAQTTFVDSSVTGGATYEYRVATYQGSTESPPAVASISVPETRLASAGAVVHGYPNPARESVTFRFDGGADDGAAARVRLVVYDLNGHKICELLDGPVPPGEQTIRWGCRSDGGTPVAPGLYNVILDGPRGRSVTRLAIVP